MNLQAYKLIFSKSFLFSHLIAKLVVFAFALSVAQFSTARTLQFENIADDSSSGLSSFVHGPSKNAPLHQAILERSLVQPLIFPEEVTRLPSWPNGFAGVAIFDFDNDGDEDIYLTNPLGSANALFSNQLIETGKLKFIDVAAAAGVSAVDQESMSVCFGDIDNDGDQDLFVTGDGEPHKLFENQGDGTFEDIAPLSGETFTTDTEGSSGCVMGDIDNDGLLEIAVGHDWDHISTEACQLTPFVLALENELFKNLGGGRFADISATSGILHLEGGDIQPGIQGLTHAMTMFDYDFDGDLDLFSFDDNCAFPFAEFGGVDYGLIQTFNNDGAGNFTNRTIAAGLDVLGTWMGVAVGDFNHDGFLDIFGTNMGEYVGSVFNIPGADILGKNASRWLLGGPGGTFTDPGVGDLIATTFGWGSVARDFDNDGHTDIAFVGGLNFNPIWSSDTPGTVLLNDGNANFTYADALDEDYIKRNPLGLATGDLNNDGFMDLVVASNVIFPEDALLPRVPAQWGSVFDETAKYLPILNFSEDFTTAVWNGQQVENGGVSVEINQANTGMNWVKVKTVGTIGLIENGKVNRDGIGAILFFTPRGGKTAIQPVLGGSSYISQNSLTTSFGLGKNNKGDIEVLWPGGLRNRYVQAKKGEVITFPEIPCDPEKITDRGEFKACVKSALKSLIVAGIIDAKSKRKFKKGMRKLFDEVHSDG